MVKKMKTTEETFKAEKEILEDFFKNKKIMKFVKTVYPSEKRNIIYITILVKLKIRKN